MDKQLKHSRAGFTILEFTIAVVILSVTGSMFAGSLFNMAQANREATTRAQAQSYISSVAESIRATDPDDLNLFTPHAYPYTGSTRVQLDFTHSSGLEEVTVRLFLRTERGRKLNLSTRVAVSR